MKCAVHMKPTKLGYFESLADELLSQSSRVRQLIGDAHWGHDGRHKETLLRNLILRHCPSGILVTAGFVVSPNDLELRSSEQDLLLVDVTAEAPLFHQGGLAIVFPSTVVAAISVKTKMTDATMKNVVQGLATVRRVASCSGHGGERVWCGGFFFSADERYCAHPRKVYDSLKRHILRNLPPGPVLDAGYPHVFGPDVLSVCDSLCYILSYERSGGVDSCKVRGFDCMGAAAAVFLSWLLEHTSLRLGRTYSAFSDLAASLEFPQLDPPVFSLSANVAR